MVDVVPWCFVPTGGCLAAFIVDEVLKCVPVASANGVEKSLRLSHDWGVGFLVA